MRVCAGCANRNEATSYTDPENEAVVEAAVGKLVAKALKTNEALQKKLDAAEAKAAQLAEDVENAKKSASALTEQA